MLILSNVVRKERCISEQRVKAVRRKLTERKVQQSEMQASEKGRGSAGCDGVKMRDHMKKTLIPPCSVTPELITLSLESQSKLFEGRQDRSQTSSWSW